MILDVNEYKDPIKSRMYLTKPDRTIVGEIHHHYDLSRETSLGSVSTIDFKVPYKISRFNKEIDNPLIPNLKNRYYVHFVDRDFDEWFIIKNPTSNMDDASDYKSVQAYSLEYELQDKRILNYEAVLIFLKNRTLLNSLMCSSQNL